MKLYYLSLSLLFLFASYQTNAQTKPLVISTNGVDSIKIGMSKLQVENITKSKLKPYIMPDSILKSQDTAMMKYTCKDCSENLICNYKGVEFLLTFFRYTISKKSDFELIGITPTSTLPIVETKTGIKVGMKDSKFIEICKKNKYAYNFMDIDGKSKGCLFSDNFDKEPTKVLVIKLSDGVITSLSVVNMVGD